MGERKHMNDTPPGGICLADYCEMFEVCHESTFQRRREVCNDAKLALARKRCESALKSCFPLDQAVPRKLYAEYSRQFCQVMNCTLRKEQREEQDSMMPVAVVLVLVILLCFVI